MTRPGRAASAVNAKKVAHVERQVAAAKKKGHQVIEGEEAKALLHHEYHMNPTGFVLLTNSTHTNSLAGVELTYGDMLANMSKKAPKPTLIVHPHKAATVLECLSHEQAAAVLRANGTSPEAVEEAGLTPWQRAQRKREADLAAQAEEDEARTSPEERAVLDTWPAIKQAVMRRVAAVPRSFSELRMIALRELECAGDFGMAEEILGWIAPDEEDEQPGAPDWRVVKVNAMDSDELAALLVMVAIDGGEHLMAGNRIAGRLHLAKHYGVDVFDPSAKLEPTTTDPGQPEAEDEGGTSTPSPAARAPEGEAAKAKPMKYRNRETGETWSGRGLMPKWLRALTASGRPLSEFEVAASAAPKGADDQGQLGLEEDSQKVDAGVAAGGLTATEEVEA